MSVFQERVSYETVIIVHHPVQELLHRVNERPNYTHAIIWTAELKNHEVPTSLLAAIRGAVDDTSGAVASPHGV